MSSAAQGDWASVAATKPQLAQQLSLTYQNFRCSRWYVLRNDSTGELCRFNKTAFGFIKQLDGKTPLSGILQAQNADGQYSISAEEALEIIDKLRDSGFLHSDDSISAAMAAEQQRSRIHHQRFGKFKNPLGIKIPLARPNSLLNTLSPWSKALFSTPALLLYGFALAIATLIATVNAAEIAATLDDNYLRPSNLAWMLLSFFLIKIVHEFSHAIFVKNWGAEVGECGIAFLLFTPLPYVDASAAWQFKEKRKRILSSAAGILAELLIAACCVIVWYCVDSHNVQAIALNTALVASVSTLVFNANPLLKFDGYYMLQDLIEIPNLHSRSKAHCLYLMKKHLLGDHSQRSAAFEVSEIPWLISYGLLSFIYRVFILFVIIFYLSKSFLIAGLLLAVYTAYQQLLKPLHHAARYLLRQGLQDQLSLRRSACSLSLLLLAIAAFVLAPVPNYSHSSGIVWLDSQTQIYSSSDAFVAVSHVKSGHSVVKGEALITLESPDLLANVARLEARVDELRLIRAEQYISLGGKSDTIAQSIRALESELLQLYTDRDNLTLSAKTSGIYMSPRREHMVGSFVSRGEFLAYVFSSDHLIVQTVIPQQKIGLTQSQVKHVEVRLENDLGKVLLASIKRMQPGGKNGLPNKALGTLGGGSIPVNPHAAEATETEQAFFQVDLALTDAQHIEHLGGLVHVRITHDSAPLLGQALQKMKHVFLQAINAV